MWANALFSASDAANMGRPVREALQRTAGSATLDWWL